jgi:O-acetylserine/cysteine efflux transporter
MKPRDFFILMLVCFIWAVNLVVGRIVIVDFGVPPLFYAAIRFCLVALMLSPLLRPVPPQLGWVICIGLLLGAGHFGLLFIGLSQASPSSSAIVLQLGIPVTAILSIAVLGENISPLRWAGIVLAVVGVIIVMWDPRGFHASVGLVFVFAATVSLSLGGILLKRIFRIKPLRLQAWVALSSTAPLALLSVLLETGQWAATWHAGWVLAAALVFSVVIVTGWSHTTWFSLLQRYEANFISPFTLAVPLMTIGMGIMVTGDHFDLRMLVGSVAALAGILIVIKAPGQTLSAPKHAVPLQPPTP